MREPKWELDPRRCNHDGYQVCPTCDFDRYYANSYETCPWRYET